MVDIYIRDQHGLPIPVRLCRRCANPKLAYIVGRLRIQHVDVPRVLGLTFGLTIAVLNVILGRVVGGEIGLFIALAGILAGAGTSIAFAVSVAMPHGGNTS
jgi:hypothetical protein